MNSDMGGNVLIVPDVHGRDFWREPVMKALEEGDARIVFLGDYLDPYSDDFEHGVNYHERAIAVFNEIIGLKKEHPDRITLLLGNHDCGYRFNLDICDVRTDYANFERIKDIFTANKDLFQLADEEYVGEKHFVMSHAGISKTYAEFVFADEVNEENVVRLFNEAYKAEDKDFVHSLGIFDKYRGYWGMSFASLVWTDARTWYDNKDTEYGYGYEVFGHTQLNKGCDGLIEEKFADIDCRKVFCINDLGELKNFSDE